MIALDELLLRHFECAGALRCGARAHEIETLDQKA